MLLPLRMMAAVALTLGLSAAPVLAATPQHVARPAATGGAWGAKVAVSQVGGHIQGNPAAAHKLIEYMSYTCSHCAHFEAETALPLRMGPVGGGQLSFEVRHLVRDPLDITIAMLTNCVPPVKFFPLHHKFLAEQDQWIATAQKLTEAQTKRWNEGQMPERMRAIASDLKFYDIAAGAGLSHAQADACFANEATLRRVIAQTKEAQELGATGTPTFTLDGKMIEEHDWAGLQPKLAAMLK
ncbi:thioredoxin domain-containing protein [Novosphingobium sp. SG707]|uniref:thioredoxin domain-containing protein n=1 Tax=Novosphingobium sp. SG707 TaxID=2586996 RepID=UPI0014467010|nr:thioredoxin domain-containing protein [Novosphingobium sp. SG707]NKJ00645.1 protein-disulfide isomerase [Novosphingobium sp. SG707]